MTLLPYKYSNMTHTIPCIHESASPAPEELTIEQRLSPPPILKGFLTKEEAQTARKENKIPFAVLFSYADCNNRCPWCCYFSDVNAPRQPEKEFTIPEYKAVIKEIGELGEVKTVFIPGRGEPLLRKRGKTFLELAQAVQDNGMYTVVISSMPPSLDEGILRELSGMDVSIIAKLESYHPPRFNELVRPLQTYQFVEREPDFYIPEGIEKLLEMGWADDHRLGCGTVVNRLNQEEIGRIFRFYRTHTIFPYVQKLLEFDGAARPEVKDDLSLKPQQWKDIAEELISIDHEEFGLNTQAEATWLFYFNFPLFMVDFDGEIKYNPKYDAQTKDGKKQLQQVSWENFSENLLLSGESKGEYFPFVKREGIFRPGLLSAFVNDAQQRPRFIGTEDRYEEL